MSEPLFPLPSGPKYQVIWWSNEWTWGFRRFHAENTSMAYIYRWMLCVGPFEVRRWNR